MVVSNIRKWLKERNLDYKYQRNQVKKAWNLYDDRKHKEVEQITFELLQNQNLPQDIYISCLILQSAVLNRSGTDFKKSYDLANQAVKLAEKYKDPLLMIEAYIETISSLIDQGDNENIINLLTRIDKLFENNSSFITENQYILAKYYRVKGLYYAHTGKIDLSLECYQKSSDIDQKIGNIYDVLADLNNIALCYALKGDLKKSIEGYLNVIDLIENSGETSKYDYLLATAFGNLGELFSEQGELDLSLEYLKKSIDLSILTSNLDNESITLANIGNSFLMKGDYENAIKHYQQSLNLFIQVGNKLFEVTILIALLSLYVLINDEENKKLYFDKIASKHNEHPNDEFFTTNYLFAKALLLKESNRFADQVEAQNIFKEIISKNEIYNNVTKESLLYYLESLIEELKISPSDSLLDEIAQTNNKLMSVAKKQGSNILVSESMLIDAKINVINLNFDHARHLLTQAQHSAEEKGLKLLSQKISKEHDNLLLRMSQYQNILNESTSIQERIELANFEEILRNMIRKSYKATEEEQEKGLIFLIVNAAGLSMFSRKFAIETEVEDQIVASLLTAINSFSQEAFKTKDTLERIKLGENTVIVEYLSGFNVCYAFKGPSYYATKKINSFMAKIQNDEKILNALQKFSTFLPNTINQNLNDLVDDIFLVQEI